MKFHYPAEVYNTNSASLVLPILKNDLPHVGSIVDFGCGIGTWLKVAEEVWEVDCMGVDNQDYSNQFCISERSYKKVDLTSEIRLDKHFDLAFCLEVAEHIPKEFSDSLIKNLVENADVILFSAAIPHQGGFGHINEVWSDYWISIFSKYHFVPFDLLRPLIWNIKDVEYYYRQNIVLFCKENNEAYNQFISKGISPSYNSYVHPDLYMQKAKMAREWDNELRLKSRSIFKKIFDRLTRTT